MQDDLTNTRAEMLLVHMWWVKNKNWGMSDRAQLTRGHKPSGFTLECSAQLLEYLLGQLLVHAGIIVRVDDEDRKTTFFSDRRLADANLHVEGPSSKLHL